MNERNCPTCNQTKNIPTLLTQCFNCWYTSSPQEKENSFQTLLTKLEQDPDQTLNWLYADAHSGQFANHPEQTWEQLQTELTTERETIQQALQTGQEWHESQKREIIAEWSNKYQNLVNKWKTTIQQELTLLRNLLSHDMTEGNDNEYEQ